VEAQTALYISREGRKLIGTSGTLGNYELSRSGKTVRYLPRGLRNLCGGIANDAGSIVRQAEAHYVRLVVDNDQFLDTFDNTFC
jgi:hypothetical protein